MDNTPIDRCRVKELASLLQSPPLLHHPPFPSLSSFFLLSPVSPSLCACPLSRDLFSISSFLPSSIFHPIPVPIPPSFFRLRPFSRPSLSGSEVLFSGLGGHERSMPQAHGLSLLASGLAPDSGPHAATQEPGRSGLIPALNQTSPDSWEMNDLFPHQVITFSQEFNRREKNVLC